MSAPVVILVTVLLIVLSAFFVIIEFALLGARRHRLEAEAETSRAARAALHGVNELTVMLAGAQLGITACTFALGAVTKPAVDHWLGPVLTDWGIPGGIASTASFLLSLLLVTFLHLVVGEMAPKSWAIARPETAAKLVALPARAFIWCVRPLLSFVNRMANRLVSASGVTPVDRAAVGGQDVDTIRHLVEHSASAGALEEGVGSPIAGVLELEQMTIGDLVGDNDELTAVSQDAVVRDVQAAAARTGHMRILVSGGERLQVVHVRDTLLQDDEAGLAEVVRPAMIMESSTPVYEALARSREASEQLVVVCHDGVPAGVVTIADMMRRVLPLGMGAEAEPAG
ncbi:hemolysin family protein [Janibacter alkaliphilus]|uniref:CBS domain containing-hemolysin-like protein n=1 Tax=Janibacter alkaliphilus TaxID=1069963 RepID=A0A852X911_9MICO|nr:CNNM domain-containing protein [Janibacter alkaliphilus]NYG36824.1 CBS domain containing-hemolysin-like protein [Janibacter alkaliphilus]